MSSSGRGLRSSAAVDQSVVIQQSNNHACLPLHTYTHARTEAKGDQEKGACELCQAASHELVLAVALREGDDPVLQGRHDDGGCCFADDEVGGRDGAGQSILTKPSGRLMCLCFCWVGLDCGCGMMADNGTFWAGGR